MRFAFFLLTLSLLLSCNLEFWRESSPVIAEVENSRLRLSELRETTNEGDSISREEWVHRIEFWVNYEVMYKEALKRGLHKDPATQRLLKNAEKKILVDRLKQSMDSSVNIESDKELQEFYDNNREKFRLDSVSYIPFSEVIEQIRGAVLSEKRKHNEKKWLAETKNNYSIEVHPEYLDSL
jgi:hypothetical protein